MYISCYITNSADTLGLFFFSPLLSYLSCSHYLSLITEFYHGGLVILASVSFSELLGAGNAAKYTKLIHRSCITDVLSSVYTTCKQELWS